ncbi:hypothetical protein ACFCV3_08135, partial [Kribbella sp. NPDC056345]
MSRILTVAADRPGAYPTIGAALLDAPDGAAVVIAAGTYAETMELNGRSITLRAEAGAEVVIDGSGADWPTIRAVDGSLALHDLVVRAAGNNTGWGPRTPRNPGGGTLSGGCPPAGGGEAGRFKKNKQPP